MCCMNVLRDVQFYQACMSMSWSIIAAWALNSYCNHVVLCATSSNLSWCIAWMCCRMSNSIKHECSSPDQSSRRGHWSIILFMFFFVLRHPTCVSCVAWMCCRMSTSINKQVWSMSRSIIAASASILIEIMLLLVLRHPTYVSCVAWMCCRMSNSIKHVWACPDLSFDLLGLYTFLHCLRSNFSPSRPLQLWFEAARESSFARDIQHTPCKAPKKT